MVQGAEDCRHYDEMEALATVSSPFMRSQASTNLSSAGAIGHLFWQAEAYGYRPEDSNPCNDIKLVITAVRGNGSLSNQGR